MEKLIKVATSNGQTVPAIQVQSLPNVSTAMGALELRSPRPVLVVVGGASKMSESDLNRLRLLFVKVLAPLAEEKGACVVDGGTDFGVMQMMGRGRAETGATFPLVGVTPVGLVALGDRVPLGEVTELEPNHTHFVLIPGSNWGDESPYLARVASVMAGEAPSVTVLVNGGEITRKDVSENLKANRPVLAIAGSGRFADTLVAALQGETNDEQAREFVATGLVQAIALEDNFESVARLVSEMLSTP
ncbi:MAG: hypothetical protein SW833_13735 [Cyanobacteriota bacterium]|nr:hypothetical protein [Cyanobacteriota bacterium]